MADSDQDMDMDQGGQGGQGGPAGGQGQGIVNPTQVQQFLEGVDYPKSKQELIDYARSKGADENVLATLEKMPDQTYSSPVDISEAIGRLE